MKRKIIAVGALLVAVSQVHAQQELQEETRIEEITIAAKTPQLPYSTGKNVQVFTKKDLEKFSGSTVFDVLNTAAGFQINGNFNNNAEPKSVKIRGGENKNVLVLLDGIPLKDVTGNDYSLTDLKMLALDNVEGIEILNGASSVLYGSNASASVINIKTNKETKKNLEGNVGMRGGSFGTFGQNMSLRGISNGITYRLTGFNEKSDGISAAKGENFDDDGYEKQNVLAGIGFSANNVKFDLNGGYTHHVYDFDNGAFQDGDNRGDDEQYFGGLSANYEYTNGALVFNSRYTRNDRFIRFPAFKTGFGYAGEHLFTELYNRFSFSENAKLVAGIQYEDQKLEIASTDLPTGVETITVKKDDTHASSIDGYLNFLSEYRNLHLDAGARYTSHSKFGSHVVYSVSPYFLKTYSSVFFKIGYSLATAFISPTLYQNFGEEPYLHANPDLNPETNVAHEINLSIGRTDQSIVLNASLFQREEKDAIVYTTLEDWTGKFINAGENTAKGFEVGLDYRISEKIKFGGNFSFVENSAPEKMLRQPKQRANAYLNIAPFKGNNINIGYQFVSKKLDNVQFPPKFETVADYSLVHVGVQQKITPALTATLNFQNILDREYTDILGYTTKPRNFNFGVSYKF